MERENIYVVIVKFLGRHNSNIDGVVTLKSDKTYFSIIEK
jgi:hypothetical protein